MEQNSFFKKNQSYILSFLIPAMIVLLIFIANEVWPFGNSMYLRSDMYHQYAPFHKELWRKIHEGGNLFYSWDIGMGINFLSLFAYYLATPTNLLLLIVPESLITFYMDLMIIIKIGLCGFTFCYYLTKHYNKKSLIFTGVSIFYALSSYTVAFCWNVMWWDCIILFPLIVLGLEALVREKKFLMYTICLGLSIISNYYIGFMLCIFSVLYFFYLLLTREETEESHFVIKRFGIFACFSLLAGAMAAFLIIPEYFTLMLSPSSESEFPTVLSNYFSIFDMLSRSLINVEASVFMAHEPNLYCGTLVFLFVPLYLIGTPGRKKEKIGKIFLLGILLVSFNMNIPNYIWHGFHYPNSLACRESFIYIFLLLTMTAEAFIHIKSYTHKQILGCCAGAIGLFILIEELYAGEKYDFAIIYISAIFMILYTYLAYHFSFVRRITNVSLCTAFLIVAISEVTINACNTGFSTTSHTAYHSDNADIEKLLTYAEEDSSGDWYRVEKTDRRSKNDAAWHGYKGVSTFVSTSNAGIADLLSKLGFEQSFNSYSNYGSTVFTNAIFNVRYLLSKDTLGDSEFTSQIAESNKELLYKNHYTLPIGFMIPSYDASVKLPESEDPFDVQEALFTQMTGYSDLFDPIETERGSTAIIKVPDDRESSFVYFYISSSCESVKAKVLSKEGIEIRTLKFDDLDNPYICTVGDVPAGGTVEITMDEQGIITLTSYRLNTELFKLAFDELTSESLDLVHWSDTEIDGTITAKQDGFFFTSIPYETGWSVCVDGSKVETTAYQNAFVGFELTKGSHTITMSYTPSGFLVGLVISSVSLFIFLLIVIVIKIIQSTNKKQTNTEDQKSELIE